MGYRVRFRYLIETGEVETFLIEDTSEGLPNSDHDARHDAVAREIARVVSAQPSISEVVTGAPETQESDPATYESVQPPAVTDRRISE